MRLATYLRFDGDCRAAFDFYARATGATIRTMLPYRDSPAEAMGGETGRDRILHATLVLGGSELHGSDSPPGRARPPQGFAVMAQVETPEEAERIFAALAEGGTVTMPLGQTFWTSRYGMLTDRFGVEWMVNAG